MVRFTHTCGCLVFKVLIECVDEIEKLIEYIIRKMHYLSIEKHSDLRVPQ